MRVIVDLRGAPVDQGVHIGFLEVREGQQGLAGRPVDVDLPPRRADGHLDDHLPTLTHHVKGLGVGDCDSVLDLRELQRIHLEARREVENVYSGLAGRKAPRQFVAARLAENLDQ